MAGQAGWSINGGTASRQKMSEAPKRMVATDWGENNREVHRNPGIVGPTLTSRMGQNASTSGGFNKSHSQGFWYSVENNLLLSIFIAFWIPVIVMLGFCFFIGFCSQFNANILGIFKRPMPANPELYFDANCIDRHSKKDFENLDQLQRCREMSNINRPGPPMGF